jgi:hypothetical protein
VIGVAVLALLLSACGLPAKEVRRFKGPGGLDGVVADIGILATDREQEAVYVVTTGASISGDPVYRGLDASLVSLRWEDDHTLLIGVGPFAKTKLAKSGTVVGSRHVNIHYRP